MAKSNLYTGTGDNGMTSLVTGQRVPKECARLEAYGTLDELSSHLGCVLSDPHCPAEDKTCLTQVQNMLFNLGGYLACSYSQEEQTPAWGLTPKHIETLEHRIDTLDASTPRIHAFVLPGGTPQSAMTHVARTVCRRAERRIFALARQEYVDPALLKYINRLSDYLFILARHLNHAAGVEEITWHKDTDKTCD